jgi:hypothetical protein
LFRFDCVGLVGIESIFVSNTCLTSNQIANFNDTIPRVATEPEKYHTQSP